MAIFCKGWGAPHCPCPTRPQSKTVRFVHLLPHIACRLQRKRGVACGAEKRHVECITLGDRRGWGIPQFSNINVEEKRISAVLLLLDLGASCPGANAAGIGGGDQGVDLFSLLQFLLGHPIAAISVSVGLAYLIPQLTKIALRFVVLPTIVVLLALLVSSNPEGFGETALQVLTFVQNHPYEVSLTALGIAGLVLSPYILVAFFVVVIVKGYQLLPQSLKPIAPKPLRQAEEELEFLQASSRSGLNAASDSLKQASRSATNEINQLLDPLVQTQKSITSRVDSTVKSVQDNVKKIAGQVDDVMTVTGNTIEGTKKGVSAVSTVIADATKCTQETTKELRRKCVEERSRN